MACVRNGRRGQLRAIDLIAIIITEASALQQWMQALGYSFQQFA